MLMYTFFSIPGGEIRHYAPSPMEPCAIFIDASAIAGVAMNLLEIQLPVTVVIADSTLRREDEWDPSMSSDVVGIMTIEPAGRLRGGYAQVAYRHLVSDDYKDRVGASLSSPPPGGSTE